MKLIYRIVNFLTFLSVVLFVACWFFLMKEVMTDGPDMDLFTIYWILSLLLMFLLALFDKKLKSELKEKKTK